MIDNDVHYLTAEGQAQLQKRLRFLVEVRRPELAERLQQAIEGAAELVDNSEYESAKHEQGFVEGEIIRLQTILNRAQIIETPTNSDEVTLGSRVTVRDMETKTDEVYLLVGPAEANPREGKISYESPAGRALMGAKVKQKVTFDAPGGTVVFKIRAIE